MNIDKEIKKILIDEGLTIKEIALKIGTSQQNISAKLKRNNPTIKDLEEILNAIGYKLEMRFIKK